MFKFTDGFLYYEEGAGVNLLGCPKISDYEILGKFAEFGFADTSKLIQACTFNNVEFAKAVSIDGNGVVVLEVTTANGKRVKLHGGETIVKTKEGLEVIK
jgi:hypothetical protein